MKISSKELAEAYRFTVWTEFIEGYEEFKRDNFVHENNSYFLFFKKKLDASYADVKFNDLTDRDLLEVCHKRFDMIDDIKENGFCPELPIQLYRGHRIYRDGPFVIRDFIFNRIDGHHRLCAALYLNADIYVEFIDLYHSKSDAGSSEMLNLLSEHSEEISESIHVLIPILRSFTETEVIIFSGFDLVVPILVAEQCADLRFAAVCNCGMPYPCHGNRLTSSIGLYVDNLELFSSEEIRHSNLDILVTNGPSVEHGYQHIVQHVDNKWLIK